MRTVATDVEWLCLSVCLLDTLVSPAKVLEPIEVLFVLWTQVSFRNHVLGADPSQGKGQLWGTYLGVLSIDIPIKAMQPLAVSVIATCLRNVTVICHSLCCSFYHVTLLALYMLWPCVCLCVCVCHKSVFY